MRLSPRIARLERAHRQRLAGRQARLGAEAWGELKNDPPAWDAMQRINPAFDRVPKGPDYLPRVLDHILADPEMAPYLTVYVAGLAAARDRLEARGLD